MNNREDIDRGAAVEETYIVVEPPGLGDLVRLCNHGNQMKHLPTCTEDDDLGTPSSI